MSECCAAQSLIDPARKLLLFPQRRSYFYPCFGSYTEVQDSIFLWAPDSEILRDKGQKPIHDPTFGWYFSCQLQAKPSTISPDPWNCFGTSGSQNYSHILCTLSCRKSREKSSRQSHSLVIWHSYGKSLRIGRFIRFIYQCAISIAAIALPVGSPWLG